MKIAVCLLVSMFAMAVHSLPTNRANRVKRGFRNGAADRFSHGFGKRGELLEDSVNSIENSDTIMSTTGLVQFLRNDAGLLQMFVDTYIDTNGDGQISREELFAQKLA